MKKISVLLLSLTLFLSVKADEGMWMLPLIEKLNIQKMHGLGLTMTAEEIYSDKNVSLKDGNIAKFPDAVTTRGQKHLETLMEVKKQGIRAVMLYIIQRIDIEAFSAAEDIDPEYAKKLKLAIASGVEVIPLMVEVNPIGIKYLKQIEYII